MISKEDILDKREQDYFQGPVYGEFYYKIEEIHKAMDEYAKEIAIGFAVWCENGGYELWDDEGDGVWFEIGEAGERIKKLTNEELFMTYLKTFCKHQNAHWFHDNAPMYCPDCKTYLTDSKSHT